MSSTVLHKFLVLIACLFFLISCDESKNTGQVIVKDTIDPLQIPTHEIWDFSMAFTDSTRNVYVQFMNNRSQPAGYMTSKSASINEVTRDMLAKGNVYVRSDSTNTTLTTQTLMWKEESRQFYTKDKIHIQTPTEIIDGYGMESDIWLKNYRIFKVSGTKFIE